MEPILLVVPREADGSRLDRFLATTLSAMEDGPSRTELQRWIQHGRVTVDGIVRKAGDKLREGARIVVRPEPPAPTAALADAGVEFDIVYIDDAVIVLDKPAGLVVHPARGHASGTLVNGLLARGVFDSAGGADGWDEADVEAEDADGDPASARARSVGRGEPARDRDRARPGIVHRLDKGTSGLMVVARHPRARERLKVQFAAHSIEREYVALCVGSLTRPLTFDTLHGRHPRDRIRFSSKVEAGKRAVTHVRPLERFGPHATFVACRLETGRTHQIRVHLSDNRLPILGDLLYGKPPAHPVLRDAALALGRPALHARVLGFVHPVTEAPMRFESEPPADFQLALETLRAIP